MPKIFLQLIKWIRPGNWMFAFGLIFFVQSSRAETPEQFARQFSNFAFKFHAEVQEPQVFLSTRSGDCDDYAILAAEQLGKGGYETQLVAVRMKGETHVVCYIPKVKGYLDYNNRAAKNPVTYCGGSLPDIASSVARSFQRNWISTYEFSYRQKVKWLVNNIVPNRPSPGTLLATVK